MSSRFTPLEQAVDQMVRQRRSGSDWREIVAHQNGQGAVRASTSVRTLQHASRVISDWFGFYNTRRPHQSLGMKTPAETYALAA